MHSKSIWKLSKRPNYQTNADKLYPYSEIPYVGQYNLIRIPEDDLIQLVDYWGEGRIVTEFGCSGFPESYCVNHEYQLVSNGPDRDTKIPNRIPVISYIDCDTSGYIKDDSVKTVTLMGAPINKSCATDVARMVNRDQGQVIVYGFKETSADIKNLELELSKKGLVFCFGLEMEALYKEPTLFDSYRAYVNARAIAAELHTSITNGAFMKAEKITKTLDSGYGSAITDVLSKLLREANPNTMIYSHKLWQAEETYMKYFPASIKLVYEGANVKILNKTQLQPLNLENSTQWQFKPSLVSNRVYFSIRNVVLDMFLDLDAVANAEGQRTAFGYKSTKGSNDYKWLLQPVKRNENLYFIMMHAEYKAALKFGDARYSAVAQSGSYVTLPDVFGWFILPVD